MNYMNLSLAWMGALNMALALYGCTNGIETGLSAPEGIPVTVLAEISPVTKSGEAVSSDNGFDRTSFLSGDQIKVTEGEEQHFQNIENLDLNMGVGELTVCYGSGKDFVLRSVGTGKFFCEQNGTTLKVNSKKAQYFFGINIASFGSSKDVAIVLEVPKGTDIRKLKAQVGVGTLTVNDLQVEELDGECGVGEFDFSGEIKKFGNLKCGIGSMYLNLVGSEKDYDYSLECGMGNISLGDRDFSGLGSGQEISNGSDKKFTLECGMGEIEVDFEKEA